MTLVKRFPVALLLLVCMALAKPAVAEYVHSSIVMETSQLETRLDDSSLRIIDYRPLQAYEAGHIPGAIHLGPDEINDPYAHIDGARRPDRDIAVMLGERGIDADTPVVIYDDQGGFHAARLFWLLEYYGHQNVALLNGGFPKWVAEDRPVTTEAPEVVSTVFSLNLSPRKHASADWILQREGQADVVVVDVRPADLHKDGHIPWATSIPWKQNLTDEGTLKPAEELIAHFADHGVTEGKHIAIHCQNGKASAHSYWALRAIGYPKLRVYDRSWAEWGVAHDLPRAEG